MASGDRGESTQPLSPSQIIEAKPAAGRRGGEANDQSIAWRGTVVGADEFAPARPKSSRAKWIVVGVLGAGAIGAGAYAITRGSGDAASPRDDARATAAQPDAGSAPVVVPQDAAAATATPTAPTDAGVAPPDAAPATTKKRGVKKKRK
jgi:hypothetical protein